MSANNQIYISSINKAIDAAKVTGKLDLTIVALFGLYIYYINFTQELIDKGFYNYNEANKYLKQGLVNLKYKYPDIICMYKTYIKYFPSGQGNENIAPTVYDITRDIQSQEEYVFTTSEFLSAFIDPNQHSIKTIRFDNINNVTGHFEYQGNIINSNIFEIPFGNITDLKFIRDIQGDFTTNFTFKVADTGVPSLYSNSAVYTIEGSVVDANSPASIGDITIYAENRVNTVLTLAMFTSQLTPPYNDPEQDLIDAIRIDEISTANEGVFLYNGAQIIEGQIVTREDLEAGLFVHQAPNQDAINSDVFNFSARDEGSMQWVQ